MLLVLLLTYTLAHSPFKCIQYLRCPPWYCYTSMEISNVTYVWVECIYCHCLVYNVCVVGVI